MCDVRLGECEIISTDNIAAIIFLYSQLCTLVLDSLIKFYTCRSVGQKVFCLHIRLYLGDCDGLTMPSKYRVCWTEMVNMN